MRESRSLKSHLVAWILVGLFLGAGCGGSSEEAFVFNGVNNNPVIIETPAPEGEATLTLESTLEVEEPILAQTIKRTVSTVQFSTFNSSGTKIFTSNPIPKSPQISVRVPLGSSQVQIDYLDPSGGIQEVWGSPIPPLTLNSEFVIRQPNPDPTANVSRVEVTGPTSFPAGIPTQFTARATYLGGATRVVTNSARFTSNGVAVMPGGVLNSGVGRQSIVATFGGRTSATFVSEARNIAAQGAPFFADASGQFVVNSLELGGFGGTAQMRLFSDFADGQRREVTRLASYSTLPAGIVVPNALGQITAVDSGSTTLTGLFQGRQGSSRITVGNDFFTTVFTNFQVLPGTLSGLSSNFLVVDFNLDGRVDIVGLPASGNGTDFTRLAVHFGNGDGTFRAAQFLNLPFSANASAVGHLQFLTGANLNRFVAVGKSDETQLAIVSFSALAQSGRQTAVRSQTLPVRPKQLMSALSDQLLIRGVDERLYRLVDSTSGPLRQLLTISYPDIDPDEFVDAGAGFVFHQQIARPGSNFFTNLRFLDYPAMTIRATSSGSGTVGGSPIRDALVFSQTRIAQFAGLGGGLEINLASLGSVNVSGNRFSPGSNFTLTGVEFGSSRRIFETIASGTNSPLVMSLAAPTRSPSVLTGYPTGTFNRFETGDVNGDGTSDIISWQNGTITIIRLAATP